MYFDNSIFFFKTTYVVCYNLNLNLKNAVIFAFLFCFIDNQSNITRPTNWDRYLGHDIRWKEGGPETIGYSEAGVFRDVLAVPPLSNITVSGNSLSQ